MITNWKTAIITPLGNPESLAKGLIPLVDFPEENAMMGNAVFELIRNQLSVKQHYPVNQHK